MDRFVYSPAQSPQSGGSSFASGLGGMAQAFGSMLNAGSFGAQRPEYMPAGSGFGQGAVLGRKGFQPQMQAYTTVTPYNTGYQPPTPTQTTGGTATGTLSGTAGHNEYDAYFVQAAQEMSQKYGVNLSPVLLKAMAHIESGGTFNNSLARDDGFGDGLSVGIMQVKPQLWQSLVPDANPGDPLGNIRLGAALLAKSMAEGRTWEQAITQVYFPTNDPNGTTQQDYLRMTMEYMNLYGMPGGNSLTPGGNVTTGWKGGSPSTHGTSTYAPPVGSALWAITGGQAFGLAQGFGMTDFAMNSSYAKSGAYAYSVAYGAEGHIGIDISTPVGTPIYAPTGGTIVTAGGTGHYRDFFGQGLGEIKMRLPNGDEVIFGHSSHMAQGVGVGTVVQPGQLIGYSGGENGPHIHLEVRVAGANTSSGYQAVDPRDYFGGSFTGAPAAGGQQTGGAMTYSGPQDLGKLLARGVGRGSSYASNYGGGLYGGGSYAPTSRYRGLF